MFYTPIVWSSLTGSPSAARIKPGVELLLADDAIQRLWDPSNPDGWPQEVIDSFDLAVDLIEAAENERDIANMKWLDYRVRDQTRRDLRLAEGVRLVCHLEEDGTVRLSGIQTWN